MKVIIQKEINSNKWNYPDLPKKFLKAVKKNNDEMIVEYTGALSITQLNSNVDYEVLEYTGHDITGNLRSSILVTFSPLLFMFTATRDGNLVSYCFTILTPVCIAIPYAKYSSRSTLHDNEVTKLSNDLLYNTLPIV